MLSCCPSWKPAKALLIAHCCSCDLLWATWWLKWKLHFMLNLPRWAPLFQFRKALLTLTVGFTAFLVSPVLWSIHICSCLAFLLFLPELALLYRSVCTMTCFKYDVSGSLLKQSAPKSAIFDNADKWMTFLFNKRCFITRVVFRT